MIKSDLTYTNPKTQETSTLYIDKGNQSGIVERVTQNGTDAVHTGVWWNSDGLYDYDGVYCIHEDTAKVLRKNSIKVPKKEFETVGK